MANPEMPRSEAEGALGSRPVTRRQVLGGMAGVAGLAAVPALVAACGPGATTTSSPGTSQPPASQPAAAEPAPAGGEVTFGSNASDAVPKAAFEKVFAAFKAASGIDVKVNTVDHGTFQDQISSYLQGAPDDGHALALPAFDDTARLFDALLGRVWIAQVGQHRADRIAGLLAALA